MQKAANSTLAYIFNPLTNSLLKFFYEFGNLILVYEKR